MKAEWGTIYRVMQEEMPILWEVIISAVVRKRFIGIFVEFLNGCRERERALHLKAEWGTIYRVMQEEMTVLWEVIISAVVRKKFIGIFVEFLNGYRERERERKREGFTLEIRVGTIYRVMQEEMTVLREVIISAVVRKKFIGIFVSF